MKKTMKSWKKRQERRAGRIANLPVIDPFPNLDWDRIDCTVHNAVCQYDHSDGFGRCGWYAVAGAGLLTRLTNQVWIPQAGDWAMRINNDADPDRTAVGVDCGEDGIEAGEFHAWIIGPVNRNGNNHRRNICLVDFSSRHYKSFATTYRPVKTRTGTKVEWDDQPVKWDRDEPPPYLRFKIDQPPPDYQFKVRKTPTKLLTDLAAKGDFNGLLAATYSLWRNPETHVIVACNHQWKNKEVIPMI